MTARAHFMPDWGMIVLAVLLAASAAFIAAGLFAVATFMLRWFA